MFEVQRSALSSALKLMERVALTNRYTRAPGVTLAAQGNVLTLSADGEGMGVVLCLPLTPRLLPEAERYCVPVRELADWVGSITADTVRATSDGGLLRLAGAAASARMPLLAMEPAGSPEVRGVPWSVPARDFAAAIDWAGASISPTDPSIYRSVVQLLPQGDGMLVTGLDSFQLSTSALAGVAHDIPPVLIPGVVVPILVACLGMTGSGGAELVTDGPRCRVQWDSGSFVFSTARAAYPEWQKVAERAATTTVTLPAGQPIAALRSILSVGGDTGRDTTTQGRLSLVPGALRLWRTGITREGLPSAAAAISVAADIHGPPSRVGVDPRRLLRLLTALDSTTPVLLGLSGERQPVTISAPELPEQFAMVMAIDVPDWSDEPAWATREQEVTV